MNIRPIILFFIVATFPVIAQNSNPPLASVPESAVITPGENAAVIPAPPNPKRLPMIESNNQTAHALGKDIRLIFEGDSITHGWLGRGKEIWMKCYAPLGAFDFGIGGDTTQNVLWRLSRGQLDGIHPKLVVLLIGTNNLKKTELTPRQIAEGVAAIIRKYQEECPDAVILLQGIFPRAQEPNDWLRGRVKEVNKILATYADGRKVLYIDFGEKLLEPDGTISPQMMPDYLHPNAIGYQIWADSIQGVIAQFFPREPLNKSHDGR